MADDNPPPQPGAEAWVSIAEAARRLAVSRQAIQRRIRRGTLEMREELAGNRRRLLVRLPQPHPSSRPSPLPQRLQQPHPQRVQAEELARLEERVAQQDRLIERLEGEVAWLRAEVERRRWPGLRRWWRRFIEGEG